MPSTQLSPLVVQRFFDNNNNPLVGGQLYTYAAGTSTPQATYTDSTGVTPNANPVILNSRGEANVWMTPGQAYKFVLQDASSNTIWTVDNINGFITGVGNLGNCRLIKSGANLLLTPYQGNGLAIQGVAYAIPSAGVSLAPTSLTPSTLYYIYAYMNGATMTLEASTTVHATDPTTGVEVKSGDSSRTLVGMARPIAGPAWADTTTQRFVVSWFNQKPIYLVSPLAAGTGNVSTGAYSIMSSTLLLEFLSWSAVASSRFQGRLVNNVSNAVSSTASFLDATNTESFTSSQAFTASAVQPVFCAQDVLVSEGYHTFQVYAQQDVSSTATYTGSATPGLRCVHSAVIQG